MPPLDDRPSLTATEAAIVDLEHARDAMAKRLQTFGVAQDADDSHVALSELDRTLYGRPVRIEIDVCIPLAELKKTLSTIRAELTNAIADIERGGPAHERRFSTHRRLCAAKTYARQTRDEIKRRGK